MCHVGAFPRSIVPVQEDISEVLEKLNMHCECMSGAGGQVSGYVPAPRRSFLGLVVTEVPMREDQVGCYAGSI